MAIIEKKIKTKYFDLIASGKKKYELRLNDFDIAAGDVPKLREWNPDTSEYTGREMEKVVTSVEQFKIQELFWPVEEIMEKGIQIISLE
jgi:ASC-1-like (ASCH) protein